MAFQSHASGQPRQPGCSKPGFQSCRFRMRVDASGPVLCGPAAAQVRRMAINQGGEHDCSRKRKATIPPIRNRPSASPFSLRPKVGPAFPRRSVSPFRSAYGRKSRRRAPAMASEASNRKNRFNIEYMVESPSRGNQHAGALFPDDFVGAGIQFRSTACDVRANCREACGCPA